MRSEGRGPKKKNGPSPGESWGRWGTLCRRGKKRHAGPVWRAEDRSCWFRFGDARHRSRSCRVHLAPATRILSVVGRPSSCFCIAAKLLDAKGKMQAPLETPVQALRITRPVEEICAWTTVNIPFPRISFMDGSVPRRHRSLSTCGVRMTSPPPTRLFDHFVSACEHSLRNDKAERFSGLEVGCLKSISAPFQLSFLRGCQLEAEPDLLWLIPAFRSVQDCLPHESHSRIPTRKTRMRG